MVEQTKEVIASLLLLTLLSVTSLGSAVAKDAQKVSVDRLVKEALANNPELAAARSQWDVASVKLLSATVLIPMSAPVRGEPRERWKQTSKAKGGGTFGRGAFNSEFLYGRAPYILPWWGSIGLVVLGLCCRGELRGNEYADM